MKHIISGWAIFLLIAALGCHSDNLKVFPATGQLTYNGVPVEDAVISLVAA